MSELERHTAPTLMLRTTSLPEAVRAVPSERWAHWLGLDEQPCDVHGTFSIGDALVVELRGSDDDRRHVTTVGWGRSGDDDALARLPGGESLVDALTDARFRDALYDFALRAPRKDSVALESESTGAHPPGAIPPSRVTHEGLLEYGESAELQLCRELRDIEPEPVEIARHLTVRRFRHAPPLLAVLSIRDRETGSKRFWGALRERWPKSVPGAVAFRSELDPRHLSDRARDLGAALWQLHRTLADDRGALRFAPRRATAADIEQWRQELVESATRSMNALLRARERIELDGDSLQLARELPARLSETVSAAAMWTSKLAGAAGKCARIHGALQLDHIHRRTDGAFCFSFVPPEARRLDSPIRDLSTLLHSVSLALHDNPCLREVRAALVNGYFDDECEQELVPPTPHRLLSLTKLLELTAAHRSLESRLANQEPCAQALWAIHVGLGERR